MTIDWSKAPEGATHYLESTGDWYMRNRGGAWLYFSDIFGGWKLSHKIGSGCNIVPKLTPRPPEPKPYTRDEALQFLVERLDSWPTDIADAPLCPGWGWTRGLRQDAQFTNGSGQVVFAGEWAHARPDFVPFVSVEDTQPATAKQPAPSGKGDPILGMVLADLTNRALEGREKYGEALKANNGRNALWDAYQEALDLAMYLRQAIEEQHRAQTDR